jgi:hypothetical protein
MELLSAHVHPLDEAGRSFQHLVLEERLRAIGDNVQTTPYARASPKLGPPNAQLG